MIYKNGILGMGVFGAFSDLHQKISVRWVCKIVSLKQPSENVCSDVSASSVLAYYLCGYCPFGTLENNLRLINQVIYCEDIGKCLITCIQVYFAL